MTTLIFSCSTGEGHNSAARAIKSVYDLHGKDSAVVDALSVFPEKAEKLICSGHTAVSYTHLDVYKRQILVSRENTQLRQSSAYAFSSRKKRAF